jgi:hypothetical protein
MATPAPPVWLPIAVLLAVCLFPVRIAAAAEAAPPVPGPAPAVAGVPAGTIGPAQPRLTITSDTTCPSGPAVVQALSALCPTSEWPSGSVRIQAVADMLVVELISDGTTRRQLRMADDCGLRATTVALIIAAWTGELSSDAAGAPVLRGKAARGEAPVMPSRVSLPAPPGVVASTTERELGAGLLLSVSSGIAPGVRIDFIQTRAPRGLGWQAGLTLPGKRERTAAGATMSWTRATASIAFNGRITLRRFAVSADAGLAGAYTLTSGHGYAIDQGAQALTGGLVAGARLALPWRRLRIWTDVRAYKWLFPQTVAVDGAAGDRVASVALPSSDIQWAVGLSYLFH